MPRMRFTTNGGAPGRQLRRGVEPRLPQKLRPKKNKTKILQILNSRAKQDDAPAQAQTKQDDALTQIHNSTNKRQDEAERGQRGRLTSLSLRRIPLWNKRDSTLRPLNKQRKDSRRDTPGRWQTAPVIWHPETRSQIWKVRVVVDTKPFKTDAIIREDILGTFTKINSNRFELTVGLRRNAVNIRIILRVQSNAMR